MFLQKPDCPFCCDGAGCPGHAGAPQTTGGAQGTARPPSALSPALRSHCTVTPRSLVSGPPSHYSVWAVAQGRASLSGCPLPLGWLTGLSPPRPHPASLQPPHRLCRAPSLCLGPCAPPPTSPASTQLLTRQAMSFHRLPQCPLPPLSLLPGGTERPQRPDGGLGHWALELS